LDTKTRVRRFSLESHIPVLHFLFLKVAEPRVIRIMHFVIYISMMFAGGGVIYDPPKALQSVLGHILIYVFGGFVLFGALLSATAVLSGIWWLERVGIIMLATSMTMYVVVIFALGSSVVAVSVAVALSLSFFQRWVEIKDAQLAPRAPVTQ
jgi:hypothetical protein